MLEVVQCVIHTTPRRLDQSPQAHVLNCHSNGTSLSTTRGSNQTQRLVALIPVGSLHKNHALMLFPDATS
jgi:hypothetical protein